MREVILGIKDYLADYWHDKILDWKMDNCLDPERHKTLEIYECPWKEGNLKHYIRQRRIAKKVKALKESKCS